jgi:hypothetical protein
VVHKILLPINDFHFLFHRGKCNPLLLKCLSCPHLTSCTPNKCKFYVANSVATVVRDPDLYGFHMFQVPNLMFFPFLRLWQKISPVQIRSLQGATKIILTSVRIFGPVTSKVRSNDHH